MFIFSEVSEEKLYTQSAVGGILSENRRLKAENDDLNGKIAAFEIVMGDLKSWYEKNGYAPDVEIRRTDGEKKSSGKEVCNCWKLRERIKELQSQIADMTEQYDSLRDEYETACLEREHLVEQIIQEKKEHNETFRKLIGALNALGFFRERLNHEMEKQNEQRGKFKITRASRKTGRRKLR